jgi:hypothetical protein
LEECVIPLIIRGRIMEDNLVPFGARRGEVRMLTPDMRAYCDELVLRNPIGLRAIGSQAKVS